ncbi:hypothetical protein [Micromonospora echinofusca]|nr:hypothetical protein [Micromonospora echinofusca]
MTDPKGPTRPGPATARSCLPAALPGAAPQRLHAGSAVSTR